MTRPTWTKMNDPRLSKMTAEGRAKFDRGYRLAALQAAIGDKVRALSDRGPHSVPHFTQRRHAREAPRHSNTATASSVRPAQT
jgi:hypothetical protein